MPGARAREQVCHHEGGGAEGREQHLVPRGQGAQVSECGVRRGGGGKGEKRREGGGREGVGEALLLFGGKCEL